VGPDRWTGIQLAGRRIFFLPSEWRALENEDPGVRIRRPPTEGTDCEEHWEVLALDDAACVDDLRQCGVRALAALDDPVSGADVDGSGWAALEVERRSRREAGRALVAAGSVPPGVPGQDERRWRHLLDDEGLGTRDRVNAADPGLAAGEDWEAELRRAHAREAMGDWRVHLRLGELSFLRGDLAAATERWEWANALRPTMWAERNLGLTAARQGRHNQAAVHYLRAHRMDPSDVELGVEAVGVLLAAGRAGDTDRVLDRMALAGQAASAQYWLLAADCAGRRHDLSARDRALDAAHACADSLVFQSWAVAVGR
jgi:tetratricopeptide (TPR) repeat protein